MKNLIHYLCVLLLQHSLITTSQELTENQITKLCEASSISTCEECISAHPECAWCKQSLTESRPRRCRKYSKLLQLGECSKENIEHPRSEPIKLVNRPLSSPGETADTQSTVVQLQPQNIKVNIRSGDRVKFNVTFRKVTDYPVDLYYLMDLSNSMEDDLSILQELGQQLANDIKNNVTQDIQMGFGTFVDKVLMPFTSTVPAQLMNPCIVNGDQMTCAPPFGFKHQQSMSEDLENFRRSVISTTISGNIDTPEGVFDALMQIAVCQENIGWRNDSTHLVVVTTDAPFHMALDGKLAAILEANDMQCHLGQARDSNPHLPSNDIVYGMSKQLDYPSIGQLRSAFADSKIQPIFAVTKNVQPLYEELRNLIPNSYVDELASDSSNIISIIKDAYDQLREKLDMTLNGDIPPEISLSYRTRCPNATEWKENSLSCDQIKIGSEITYEFDVKATSCGKQSSFLEFTSNSLQDRVRIEFNFLCDCPCSTNVSQSSASCNGKGALACGICRCDSNYEGSTCQCARDEADVSLMEKCKMPGSDAICNGNGQCECGQCLCDDGYSKEFCQCSNKGCSMNNDGVCGGPDKGFCTNCGDNAKCNCTNGWTLEENIGICTCKEELCRDGNTTCSGNGVCECNRCECNEPDVYTGTFCETCINPKCRPMKQGCNISSTDECAKCLNDAQRRRENENDRCRTTCEGVNSRILFRLPDCSNCQEGECRTICDQIDESILPPEECFTTPVNSTCKLEYRVVWSTSLNDYLLLIKAFNQNEDCPQAIDPLLIVLPIVGGIVLVGIIALFAWKIFQTIRDKREWISFENEMKQSKWTKGQNPIFEKPSTRFENPTFSGN